MEVIKGRGLEFRTVVVIACDDNIIHCRGKWNPLPMKLILESDITGVFFHCQNAHHHQLASVPCPASYPYVRLKKESKGEIQ